MRTACTVACLGSVLSTQIPQRPEPSFRASVEMVSIYATVRTDEGPLVPDLTVGDFEVRDNGVVQDVTLFSREIVPITVAIMVDVSGSQETNVVWARDAAKAFISALGPADRARVGTFGVEVAISFRLTNDKVYLNRILDEEVWPGGGTPLWQAIDLAMNSLQRERGRKVVLLLTDGVDQSDRVTRPSGRSATDPLQLGGGSTMALPMSQPAGTRPPAAINVDSVTDRAIREEFMIYAVGRDLEAPSHAATLSAKVQSVAEESGGGYRRVPRSRDAAVVMGQVAEELRHQYLIGFTPSAPDGKIHKLAVIVKRDGMSARARKSYMAAK